MGGFGVSGGRRAVCTKGRHITPQGRQARMTTRRGARSLPAALALLFAARAASVDGQHPGGASGGAARPEWRWLDASLPVDARVAALLAELTQAEKVAQTVHLTGGAFADVVRAYGATGLGAFPSYSGGVGGLAARNALQAAIMNASRLQLPVSFHSETLHGACGGCTIFPMPAAQGATWNAPLVGAVARAIAVEAFATGIDRGFSPEINVPTDARFGRTEENFGEDPMLVGALGAAAVRGLHGGDAGAGGPSSYLPAFAIVSEAKHAAAYAFGGKDGMAAELGERALHDVYLRPWREYAQAGGRGLMLAHNSINQLPCHSSTPLMAWLRAQGNLSGALFGSDMCDVGLLGPNGFRVAAGLEAAAALAMTAGLDQELCNPTDGRGQAFTLAAQAVADGLMPQAALDRATANVLRAKFAAGLFDGRAIVNASDLDLLDSPANRALARQVALEGTVLLKAAPDVLPLRLGAAAAPLRVAIVGPLAGCADNASSCDATLSQTGGYTNNGVAVISVLAAAYNESGVAVTYAPGSAVGGNDTSGFAEAVALARAADVVLFVGGDSGGLGWNKNTCGEDDDRSELDLPGVQSDLVAALADTGVPVVLALIHGRPVTFVRSDLLSRVAAVFALWRPGEEGGPALWALLSGRAAPSGRLAQAWVRSVGQVKSQASPWFSLLQGDFDRVSYNGDAIASGGAASPFAPWAPAFPFGFGLTYTTFAMSLLNATVSGAGAAATVTTFVRVTNTGAAAAKQVVQVYFSQPLSALVRYHARLLAFAKTDVLAPQEAVTLAIAAPAEAFASYDPALGALTVEAGAYSISVGASSEDISGTATITLSAGVVGLELPKAAASTAATSPVSSALPLTVATAAASAAVAPSTLPDFTSVPAADLQPLFLQQVYGAEAFLGADVCTSLPLSDSGDVFLYLFGDTITGRFFANATRAISQMPRNSVGLLLLNATTRRPRSALSHHWRVDPARAQHVGFFSPPEAGDEAQWYWPTAGVRVYNRSYVVSMRMRAGGSGEFAFAMAGYDVITLPDDPRLEAFDDPLQWPDPLPTATVSAAINDNFTVGNAVTYVAADDSVYMLGSYKGARSPQWSAAFMTRIAAADFAAMAFDARLLYKLRNGSWSPYYAAIGDDLDLLFDFDVPSETTITWSAALQLWLMPIANTFLYGDSVMLRTAPALDGPWSAAVPLFAYPPQLKGGPFCYAGKVHEELSDPLAKEFVFTFNCNTNGLGPLDNQPDVYIPQVVRTTWA